MPDSVTGVPFSVTCPPVTLMTAVPVQLAAPSPTVWEQLTPLTDTVAVPGLPVPVKAADPAAPTAGVRVTFAVRVPAAPAVNVTGPIAQELPEDRIWLAVHAPVAV